MKLIFFPRAQIFKAGNNVDKVFKIQWKLIIMRPIAPGHFVRYIRDFVLLITNAQYKTKQIS